MIIDGGVLVLYMECDVRSACMKEDREAGRREMGIARCCTSCPPFSEHRRLSSNSSYDKLEASKKKSTIQPKSTFLGCASRSMRVVQ